MAWREEGNECNYTSSVTAKDLAASWMMAANSGAYSSPHVDASGYCTWIKMVKGTKIWWLARDAQIASNPNVGWEQATEFYAIHLKQGDEL